MEEENQEESREEENKEENAKAVGQELKRGARIRAIMREHFSAPRLAYMALFTALAYIVTFFEFSIFPNVVYASQLKLDFANVFFMIEGFIFGPVEAIVSIGIKECLCVIDSATMGVGELANFLMSFAYVIIPAIGYRFLKGKKWVLIFLVCACVFQIAIGFLVNRYVNFPFFGFLLHFDGVAAFWSVWHFIIAFNAIKSVCVSVVVFLVYKPLSKFIRATDLRFRKRMQKAKERRRQNK